MYLPEFTLEEPICFRRLNIIYLAGHVNCRNPDHGKSHFGCDRDSIGLVLTSEDGTPVFPKAVNEYNATGFTGKNAANQAWNEANIEGYQAMAHGHADWYRLDSYTGNEKALRYKLNQDEDGGVFLPKGNYRLWYHEDLTGGTEGDNSGIACYHMNFILCQGNRDPEWSIETVDDFDGMED